MIDLKYNQHLRRHIRSNLKRFALKPRSSDGLKMAAVAVTLVEVKRNPGIHRIPFSESRADHAAILLTRRASGLRNHAGQWALPGGRMDLGESAEETVLRELEEEVGLRLGADRLLGRLDDYSTRSGFTIKPIVVWGGTHSRLRANPDEVASIHRIPLAEFMREDAPVLKEIPESDNPVLYMPIGNSCIAAPTAAILYQFREVAILGGTRRVDHYEQPYFAWQ